MSKSIKINLIIISIFGLILAGAFHAPSILDVKAQTGEPSTNTYGVSVDDNGNLSGYAWGSDVIGWIDFTGVKLSAKPVVPIVVNIYANNTSNNITINSGQSATIKWDSTGAEKCIVSENGTPFSQTATSGTKTFSSLTATKTYIANCSNTSGTNGNSLERSVTVNINTPQPPVGPRGIDECPNTDPACTATIDTCSLSDDGQSLNCVDPITGQPLAPIPVSPQQISTCKASQSGNEQGDNNIYVNRTTTWTLTTSSGGSGPTKWKGTNISGTVSGSGLQLNKIYTTVGKKEVNGMITLKDSKGASYNSFCKATTTVKLDTGTGGEI